MNTSPMPEPVALAEAVAEAHGLRERLLGLARDFIAAPERPHDELLVAADRLERLPDADVFDVLLAQACRRAAAAPRGNWPLVRAGLAELLGGAPGRPRRAAS